MNTKRTTSWVSSVERGLSLIEVLAALTILSLLLAGLLAVKAGAERQWHSAERKLEAVAVADALIGAWVTAGTIPAETSGYGPDGSDLIWRTHLVLPVSREAPVAVVRLDVLDAGDGHVRRCRIELCVPWGVSGGYDGE